MKTVPADACRVRRRLRAHVVVLAIALIGVGGASTRRTAASAASQTAERPGIVVRGESATPPDWLTTSSTPGLRGGRVVTALRAEPRTWNPVTAVDNPSRDIIRRLHADLVTIDRNTHRTELALARAIERAPDGRRIVVRLRRGVRFSDGHAFDADDVVFSFGVYLDERSKSPQRELLMVGGQPISVNKLDAYSVEFLFAAPYGPAERLFDSVAILPRHVLEPAQRTGALATAWGLGTPPATIVGLGPFRLRSFAPGQAVVLERNPYYWKRDRDKTVLPYLDELAFVFAANEDAQALRFEAGELDLIDRVGAEAFERLQRTLAGSADLRDLGAALDFTFLMFNQNVLPPTAPTALRQRHTWFGDARFRRAISLAVDRDAMVSLVYRGKATPLWWHVSPNNRAWVNTTLPKPQRSVAQARALLTAAGFSWNATGALADKSGTPVSFSLLTSASNAQRAQLATLLQTDLKSIGISVNVVSLDFGALLERVLRTHDYDAAIMALATGDVDPGAELNVWKTTGGNHLWRLAAPPATQADRDIDRLLDEQMATIDTAARKAAYDRVQAILVDEVPIVTLVGTNVLVGARRGLANLRPGILDHHLLWNADELYWSGRPQGPR